MLEISHNEISPLRNTPPCTAFHEALSNSPSRGQSQTKTRDTDEIGLQLLNEALQGGGGGGGALSPGDNFARENLPLLKIPKTKMPRLKACTTTQNVQKTETFHIWNTLPLPKGLSHHRTCHYPWHRHCVGQ